MDYSDEIKWIHIEYSKLTVDPIIVTFSLAQKRMHYFLIQWGWDITGQKITGQSVADWLKITSTRTSKPNRGGLSRF